MTTFFQSLCDENNINEQEEKHWILYECIEIKQLKIMDQGRNEEENE